MSKLENYKYIDDNKLIKKYEITPMIDISNNLDNHFRNTLKDFSPEPATFEFEKKRTNTDSVGKLNVHYYGRRNDTEPFQSDLFLGFTDKDPRSIHQDPLMGNYQKQIWHRKDNYKYSFKDDSDNSIPTSGISESKMQKNKKITYQGFKERYKNFEESNDAWTNSFNQIDIKNSKVLHHTLDGTVANLSDVDDIKKRRDYVATLSLNALPVGWLPVPDHKVKIAQYSKLLKSKNLNDIDVIKNKNQQLKDNKVIDNSDKELQLMNQLLLLNKNIENKKKENFENEINNILFDDEEDDSRKSYMNKLYLNKILNDKQNILEDLSNKCQYYKKLAYNKYRETIDLKNQIFIFYILLFISIVIIIYQKMNITNMKNILYILEIALQKKMTEEKKII